MVKIHFFTLYTKRSTSFWLILMIINHMVDACWLFLFLKSGSLLTHNLSTFQKIYCTLKDCTMLNRKQNIFLFRCKYPTISQKKKIKFPNIKISLKNNTAHFNANFRVSFFLERLTTYASLQKSMPRNFPFEKYSIAKFF